MNTANKLTLFRVAMIPVFLLVLYFNGPRIVALVIFVLACVTDFVDGYVARHFNQITNFGKFMDPLADKLLVVAAMLWFVEQGRFAAWAVLIIVAREFAVTGLRLVAVEAGRVIAAGWSGKVKTAATMIGICLMLAVNSPIVDQVVLAVVVVATLYSGAEYFLCNRDVFKDGEH
ncbi:MAG: CDP-diacylglycerol--glycerol-3-phosphate 3-phosphatidyltransferase [Oscillospiraceae bacterium]|nr:CDP-diacylglycerol--glycerol-3-phosphate 3-phosphatidyltransferase [Oscillospiraceae bacterium]